MAVRYEDEVLLALEKPSGLLTSPDRYDPDRPNLMKLLHHDIARNAAWVRPRNLTYLANVHRLDFETSGIILLAKNKPALVALADQFGAEKPAKVYFALVHGTPPPEFEVDAKLGPHPLKVGLIRVDPKQGKKSITRFKTVENFAGYSLVECRPLTGRTHQIRVHLKHQGFPIVGDALYQGHPLLLSRLKPGYRLKPGRVERPLMERVALHAAELLVAHPVTGLPVEIKSPLPKDFLVALKYLRLYASGFGLRTQQQENDAEADDRSEAEQE